MNDKELAAKIEALGVNRPMLRQPSGESYTWTYQPQPDSEFVRDGRVAMAMMEKYATSAADTELRTLVWTYGRDYNNGPKTYTAEAETRVGGVRETTNESLPRAINEACCEALS